VCRLPVVRGARVLVAKGRWLLERDEHRTVCRLPVVRGARVLVRFLLQDHRRLRAFGLGLALALGAGVEVGATVRVSVRVVVRG
jgi:hypothetical protein